MEDSIQMHGRAEIISNNDSSLVSKAEIQNNNNGTKTISERQKLRVDLLKELYNLYFTTQQPKIIEKCSIERESLLAYKHLCDTSLAKDVKIGGGNPEFIITTRGVEYIESLENRLKIKIFENADEDSINDFIKEEVIRVIQITQCESRFESSFGGINKNLTITMLYI